jgi:hypothetical protein
MHDDDLYRLGKEGIWLSEGGSQEVKAESYVGKEYHSKFWFQKVITMSGLYALRSRSWTSKARPFSSLAQEDFINQSKHKSDRDGRTISVSTVAP